MLESSVILRPVVDGDKELLFRWRNDPWIVSLGSSNKTVTPEEHSSWFDRTLSSPDHLLFIIGSAQGEDMGIVRYHQEDSVAEISIYLMKSFTGRGHGVSAIRASIPFAFGRWAELKNIIARIRPENQHSIRTFEKIQFSKTASESEMVVMSFSRDKL